MKTLLVSEDGLTEPGSDTPDAEALFEVLYSVIDSLLEQGEAGSVKALLESIGPEYSESLLEQNDYAFDDIQQAVIAALAKEYPNGGNGSYPGGGSRYYIKKLWPDKFIATKSSYGSLPDDDDCIRCDFTLSKDKDTSELTATLGDATPVTLVYIDSDSVPDGALEASAENLPTETLESTVHEDIESQELVESFDTPLIEAVIEELGNKTIIRNVVVLGENSVNGRKYPPETQIAARTLFEGAKAYLNHPAKDSTGSRDLRDIIGKHRDIRQKGTKTYSDLHLINNSVVKDIVLPAVRFDPSLIGNSIVAQGKLNAATGVVESITKVRSIDLVCEPATTRGLLEDVQHDGNQNNNNVLRQRPITNKNLKEEKGMEIKEAKDLRQDATLYESVRTMFVDEFKKENEWKTLQESLEREKKRADEADAKLLKMETEKKEVEKKAEIDRMLTEAKIPEESKTDKLRSTLYSRTAEDAKEFITSLEESIAEVRKQFPSKPTIVSNKGKPVVKNPEKVISSGRVSKDEQLTEAHYTQAFAAFSKQ